MELSDFAIPRSCAAFEMSSCDSEIMSLAAETMAAVASSSVLPTLPSCWTGELGATDLLALALTGGWGPSSAPPKKCTTAAMCLHSRIRGKSLQLQVVVSKLI